LNLATLTPKQIKAADRTLSAGTWTITAGAILFSVLTVTPLVKTVTPPGWGWTAPILPLVVDAAVVIVIRLDATVSRLGGDGGRWPVVLRWLTGLFTIALNIGNSALHHDKVGVAVHAVSPILLIVTAEAGLAYRRAIARGLERIAREQAAEAEAKRVHQTSEREAREQHEREEAERQRVEREREEDRAEGREREAREATAREERERREHEAQMLRDQREYEAAVRKDEADREERERERQQAEAREREERDRRDEERREQQEREDRERKNEEAREQSERAIRERQERRVVNTSVNAAVNTRPKPVNAPAKAVVNKDQMPETDARHVVLNTPGASVRQLAETTGWSVGWVSKVRHQAADAGGQEEAAA
jgi:Protein of unknown function (DUF2637)